MAARSPISSPGDWKVVRLGQIALKIGSGATPTGGEESYLPARERFALIRSQNVFDRYFDSTGLAFISDEQASRLQGVVLQPGDLLLNITGDGVTFSRACAVPSDVLPACVNQHVAIVRIDKTVADGGYVLSYLTHPAVKSYIESFNAGGSRRAITKGHIESFEIPLPPLAEQRAIAHILGALDDKIELNRRMNETLEAIARALFKSWFVDCGPTHAKADGRHPPRLAAAISTLLPSAFADNGKPLEWCDEPLLDHARLISGGTPRTDEPAYWGGEIPWASAKDVSQCRDAFLIATERMITDRGLNESATRIVPKLSTVVVARGATTGRFCLIGRDMAMNQTCYALTSSYRRPFWLNCAFGSLVETLVNAAHGSVFDTITTNTIERARVTIPSNDILDHFETMISPFFHRVLVNIQESQTLASLRDLLLPKLISGELRVTGAERVVASASMAAPLAVRNASL